MRIIEIPLNAGTGNTIELEFARVSGDFYEVSIFESALIVLSE